MIEPVPSLHTYFRDAIGAASTRRRILAAPETADYLADLLSRFATGQGSAALECSIVLTLDEALSRGAGLQLAGLQAVGDVALYTVGFFPDQLARAQVDAGLYVHVGAFAYGRAAEIVRATGAREPTALVELAENFPRIADVVGEVATSSALGTVTKNLVKLFDRWKSTGSVHALEAMARIGAFPSRGGGAEC